MFAVLVGRQARARWAASCLVAGVGAAALAWAGSEGWLGAGGGASLVLAAPIGVAVAVCCGLGVSVIEHDVVRRAELGWQQAAGAVAAVVLLVGLFPALAVAAGGHGDLPPEGMAAELDFAPQAASVRSETLWLGDPGALPAAGWQLSPGLSFFLARGLPTAREDWPAPSPGRLDGVVRALGAARRGRTIDLGSLLAPFGVRYIVLPLADAPETAGSAPPLFAPPPHGLVQLLAAQDDLVAVPIEAGARLFVNDDWSPADGAGTVAALGTPPAPGSSPLLEAGVAAGLGSVLGALVTCVLRRRRYPARGRGRRSEGVPPREEEPDSALSEADSSLPVAVGAGVPEGELEPR